jgi:hypothetical protein
LHSYGGACSGNREARIKAKHDKHDKHARGLLKLVLAPRLEPVELIWGSVPLVGLCAVGPGRAVHFPQQEGILSQHYILWSHGLSQQQWVVRNLVSSPSRVAVAQVSLLIFHPF